MQKKFLLFCFFAVILAAVVTAGGNFAQDEEEEFLPSVSQPQVEEGVDEEEDLEQGDDLKKCRLPHSLLPAVDAVIQSLRAGATGNTSTVTEAIKQREHARHVYKKALHRYQKAKKAFKESKALSQAASVKCEVVQGSSVKELALLRILDAKISELVNSGKQLSSETTLLQAVVSETSNEELRQNLVSAMTSSQTPERLLSAVKALIAKILSHHGTCSSNARAHSNAHSKVRQVLLKAHKALRHAAADERTASRRVIAARTGAMRNSCSAAFSPAIKHIKSLRHTIKQYARGEKTHANTTTVVDCPPCPACTTVVAPPPKRIEDMSLDEIDESSDINDAEMSDAEVDDDLEQDFDEEEDEDQQQP